MQTLEEVLPLLIEACVLDGDRRMRGEHHHEGLVVGRELLALLLVGQVQVADRSAPSLDRHTEERVHVRMVLREPRRERVVS